MLIFWKEPKITLAGTSIRCQDAVKGGFVTNDTRPITSLEALPEVGGRICYMSFGKGRSSNKEYLANIIAKGHESVLEHGSVSFIFEGISRSCANELVRHRHFSYSQLSQRYCRDVAFVYPPDLKPEDVATFEAACREARLVYTRLLGDETGKTVNAVARSVLPNATETKIMVTGNLRAWRHFIKLRATEHAEAEIRRLACNVFHEMEKLAPNVFQDLEYDATTGTVRTVSTQ